MKRIILMAALVLSLSACDNTKLQLRAPQPNGTEGTTSAETKKSDSLLIDTIKKDTVLAH